MKIQKIIAELLECNVIPAKPSSIEKLSGGTVSELYLLSVNGSKHVLKLNDPDVTGSEALFLETYKEIGLLPRLLYTDPSGTYMVYSFINGSTPNKGVNKKETLKALVEGLLNHYKPVSLESGWGWTDSASASWTEFLTTEIASAQKIIGSQIDERTHKLVNNLAERICTNSQPFLLHGDCGFHNFIFTDKALVGVIDPAPIIGDPLYDLVYAFCSSSDDLTRETFDHAVHHLKIREEKDTTAHYGNLLIGLYLRIALCKKHHPADLPKYLEAWSQWLELSGNGESSRN